MEKQHFKIWFLYAIVPAVYWFVISLCLGNLLEALFWCLSPVALLAFYSTLARKTYFVSKCPSSRLLLLPEEYVTYCLNCSLATFRPTNNSRYRLQTWFDAQFIARMVLGVLCPVFHVIFHLDKRIGLPTTFIPGVLYLTNYRLFFYPNASTGQSGGLSIFFPFITDKHLICSGLKISKYIVVETFCREEWFTASDAVKTVKLIDEHIKNSTSHSCLAACETYIRNLSLSIDRLPEYLCDLDFKDYTEVKNVCDVNNNNNNEEYQTMAHVRTLLDVAMTEIKRRERGQRE